MITTEDQYFHSSNKNSVSSSTLEEHNPHNSWQPYPGYSEPSIRTFISSLDSTERVLRGSPRPAPGASGLRCQPWPGPGASRGWRQELPPARRTSAFLKKPGRPGTEGKESTSPRIPFCLCLGFVFLPDFYFKGLSDHRHQPQGAAACPGNHPWPHSR